VISFEFSTEQITRLAALEGFPSSPEVQFELVEALLQCDDETQCKELVDGWVGYETRCPKAAEIREAIRNTRTVPPRVCSQCGGVGWVSFERDGCSFADPCPACRRPQKTRKREPPTDQSSSGSPEFDGELHSLAGKKSMK
jgi:hypothetical protein